jgi:hypothetical protein
MEKRKTLSSQKKKSLQKHFISSTSTYKKATPPFHLKTNQVFSAHITHHTTPQESTRHKKNAFIFHNHSFKMHNLPKPKIINKTLKTLCF